MLLTVHATCNQQGASMHAVFYACVLALHRREQNLYGSFVQKCLSLNELTN